MPTSFHRNDDAVQHHDQTALRLLGYQQSAGMYEPLAYDERGWLWLEPVGLWLGIQNNEVYGFDERGTQIGDYAEIARELSEAEARIRELEVEVRRLRGEE